VGDPQEYWWAESTGAANQYWIINFYWSTASNYAYMTEAGLSGSAIVLDGPGFGLLAEWHYL
jgi:hypothetical protein